MNKTPYQFKCVVYFDEVPGQRELNACLRQIFRIVEGVEFPSLREVNLYLPPDISYEQALRLGGHLQHAIQRHGLRASIGLATTQTAARAAARSKPFKITLVEPGTEARFMRRLPIEAVPGFGKQTQTVLRGLGMKRVGQMQAVPEHSMISLFGPSGRQIALLARGLDVRIKQTAPVFHMAPRGFSGLLKGLFSSCKRMGAVS